MRDGSEIRILDKDVDIGNSRVGIGMPYFSGDMDFLGEYRLTEESDQTDKT